MSLFCTLYLALIYCILLKVASPEWAVYAKQVLLNSRAIADRLKQKGYKLATDGTDNHLVLWDLRHLSITGSSFCISNYGWIFQFLYILEFLVLGSKFEKLAEAVGISLNKNTVPGDSSALNPSGVRIGTPAMTTRGCKEADSIEIADLLIDCAELCVKIQGIVIFSILNLLHYFHSS